MKRVLFLCTGNSCRSQMAEGWARFFLGNSLQAFSAGIIAKGLDPRAARVMAEAGVDISAQTSKTVSSLIEAHRDQFGQSPDMPPPFDLVITVCGHAHETCPRFPGKVRVIHHGFDDPPHLADTASSEDEALGHYRRVRDEIRAFVEHELAALLD